MKTSTKLYFAGLALLMLTFGCSGTEPEPKQYWKYTNQFHTTIKTADQIVVKGGGTVLFEITDFKQLQKIYAKLQFTEAKPLAGCLCAGFPTIEWRLGSKVLAHTTVQHGVWLQWAGFQTKACTNAPLTDESMDWLEEWLNENGVKTNYPGNPTYWTTEDRPE